MVLKIVKFHVCERNQIAYNSIKAFREFLGSFLEFHFGAEIAFLQQHFSKNLSRFPYRGDAFSVNQYFVLFSE